MAGGQLTPRQKMINMMYLVLTALLAMNVSSEVLEAFKLVETGIANSNKVLVDKVKFVDGAFQGKMSESENGPALYQMTKDVSAEVASLNAYIEGIRTTLLGATFAGSNEDGSLKKLDDIDSPTRLLADEQSKDFKGKEFQDKIKATRAKIEAIIDGVPDLLATDKAALKNSITLIAEDYPEEKDLKKKWFYKNFFSSSCCWYNDYFN